MPWLWWALPSVYDGLEGGGVVGPNFYFLYFNTPSSSYFTKRVEYGLMDFTLSHANFRSFHTTQICLQSYALVHQNVWFLNWYWEYLLEDFSESRVFFSDFTLEPETRQLFAASVRFGSLRRASASSCFASSYFLKSLPRLVSLRSFLDKGVFTKFIVFYETFIFSVCISLNSFSGHPIGIGFI